MDLCRRDPDDIRYLLTWTAPPDLHRFRNLEILFSIGAGIDQFKPQTLPPNVKLVRMVEDGIVRMMQEYVTLAVLALHRTCRPISTSRPGPPGSRFRCAKRPSAGSACWASACSPQAVLERLKPFGFPLSGLEPLGATDRGCRLPSRRWTAHAISGAYRHPDLPAAADGRDAGCWTPTLFAKLPAGAALVHVGRGAQLDHHALIAALDARASLGRRHRRYRT